MKPRRIKKSADEVVIPDAIMVRVRATAWRLGMSSTDVAVAGCRLFCAYVMAELEPRLDPKKSLARGGEKWQVEKLVRALASSLGRKLPK